MQVHINRSLDFLKNSKKISECEFCCISGSVALLKEKDSLSNFDSKIMETFEEICSDVLSGKKKLCRVYIGDVITTILTSVYFIGMLKILLDIFAGGDINDLIGLLVSGLAVLLGYNRTVSCVSSVIFVNVVLKQVFGKDYRKKNSESRARELMLAGIMLTKDYNFSCDYNIKK